MKKYDVLIIGSGLGGLLCGCILSKEGYNVCVVEKNQQIGGCLQTFKREGCVFDTGIHYIGSMDQDQILYRYFKYFGLVDKLKLQRMDTNGFDTIKFGDDNSSYKLAMGEERFVESLSKDFPKEKKAIKIYMQKLNDVSDSLNLVNLRETSLFGSVQNKYLSLSASEFIKTITQNTKLQNVLSGNNSIYAGDGNKTSLYMHSLIQKFFINSAWRFVDGSDQLAFHLTELIKSNNGTVLTRHEVKKINYDNGILNTAECTNGELIQADYFISNVHPSVTLDMIDTDKLKKIYRKRIKNLENTISSFSIYAVLKDNSFPYINSNIHFHKKEEVWNATNYTAENWPKAFFFITPAISKSHEYADSLSILTYMKYSEVEKWDNTTIENRGEEYKDFKFKKAEKLLDEAEKIFPNLRNSIKSYYTSSPLTYRDYTATVNGSLYGIVRDYNRPLESYIHPRTKISNLFLTGQNINMHGALGVTIGSVLTCAELIGLNYLIKRINDAQ